ncbi:hypothetical protein BZA70DRAFT_295791 [Myxozyma melibiosi]|uniref:Smr domain-containing protein n=1 Tax=Myxozyma melibiosi TaxID=54550 RepID=A0ABR1F456_9ASCO
MPKKKKAQKARPADSEDIAQVLQAEFPDLDSSLIAALALDFSDIDKARELCASIAYEALIDKADVEGAADVAGNASSEGSSASCSDYCEGTMSWDLESSTTDDSPVNEMARKPRNEKLQFLKNSFPSFDCKKLERVLTDCNNDVSKAIDEVLSLSFLSDTDKDSSSSTSASAAKPHDWASVAQAKKSRGKLSIKAIAEAYDRQEDVETVTSLLDLPADTVSKTLDLYPKKPASALVHLITYSRRSLMTDWCTPPAEESRKAKEQLQNLIPNLPDSLYSEILLFTNNNLDKAVAFSVFLIEKAQEAKEDLQLIATLIEANSKGAAAGDFKEVTNKWANHTIVQTSSAAPAWTSSEHTTSSTVTVPRRSKAELEQLIRNKVIARDEARAKAGDLYKRRNTKDLHTAAPLHYANVSREITSELDKLRLDLGRLKVAETATQYSIDLHGVEVKEANKIAHEYVDSWWHESQRQRLRAPFSIITGRGAHSAQGTARLLPFISQSLAAEGWRIQVKTGSIDVLGVENE